MPKRTDERSREEVECEFNTKKSFENPVLAQSTGKEARKLPFFKAIRAPAKQDKKSALPQMKPLNSGLSLLPTAPKKTEATTEDKQDAESICVF